MDASSNTTIQGEIWEISVCEGFMDAIHGGGHRIRELFIPAWNASFNATGGEVNVVSEVIRERYAVLLLSFFPPTKIGDVTLAVDDATALRALLDAHRMKKGAARLARAYLHSILGYWGQMRGTDEGEEQ